MSSQINCVLIEYLDYFTFNNLVIVCKNHPFYLGGKPVSEILTYLQPNFNLKSLKNINNIIAKAYLITIKYPKHKILEYAIKTNNLIIVKICYRWLNELKFYTINKNPYYGLFDISNFEKHCCSYAARFGNFDLVIFLHEKGFPWKDDILTFGAMYNNLKIFKYVQKNKKKKYYKIDYHTLEYIKITNNNYINNWINQHKFKHF